MDVDVDSRLAPIPPVLDARGITKHYDGVTALNQASLSVRQGEIHALLGGNGAGKSTMISIISGATKPDEGTILLGGEPLAISGPQGAITAGISTIYQELSLVPALSALDNIFLGREIKRRVLGIPLVSDRRRMENRVRDLAKDFGISRAELHTPVSEFGALKKRSLEIVKALAFDPKVLILDEPTSGLEDAERASLFEYMRSLRERNVALIWVTHHLEELAGLADRATVFRDGRNVATVDVDSAPIDTLLTYMFGDQREEFGGGDTRHLNRLTPLDDAPVVLSVRGLSRGSLAKDISFEVHEGEVVGLAGLAGAGRTEVVRTLMGLDARTAGTVELDGKRINPRSSSAAYRAGLAMLPEDRKQLGILTEMSIASNISISKLSTVSRARIWLSAGRERALAEKYGTRLGIKAPNVNTRIGNLSGGNQQKAIVARCLNTAPRLLIFDEPTQGIDVSAKVDVHALIRHFSADGGAAILIASEFEELLELSHRVLVLKKGRIVGEIRDIPKKIAAGGFAELKSKVLALSAAGAVE
ncbi:sugar ABC transporter ATP-binding protein [Microbacterium rhizomatis]|uniref:Sugar ABC transporter ATP-binding protein n=1 Tax=Microbacterium rhizomatis TaxID=1631477 RepID=A0A5J5J0R9_9MICO|nr:sugar ABC transporter ATP-binding protein [Microbacterium rhizomatis]KAA9105539.1 sugar ABC transporter ATP-binding protein [Microbacterium rhizomatis]